MNAPMFMEVDQGSPEWFAARTGILTASKIVEVRKRLKSGPRKGKMTSAAMDYAFRLAVERKNGEPLDDTMFETAHMRRGRELEPDDQAPIRGGPGTLLSGRQTA